MKFSRSGPRDYDDYDGPGVPDGYVAEEQAFEWVFENERDAVDETIQAEAASQWLRQGTVFLAALNAVSQHDKEQMKEVLIGDLGAPPKQPTESHLFLIASEVSRLMESADSPCAKCCTLSDDLTWVEPLIQLTRAVREILFFGTDADNRWTARRDLEQPLSHFNSALRKGRLAELDWNTADSKSPTFLRRIDYETTPIETLIANWMAEYFADHSRAIAIAVCVECGTLFVRERRDNVYCSKTCQNRVAYKRKRIFDSGTLKEETINPDSPANLIAGLWVHHPRLGLGRIESVKFGDRKLWVQFEKFGFGSRIYDGSTVEEELIKAKDQAKGKPITWEEVVDPTSLEAKIRFLQLVRTFSWSQLFPVQKGENVPTFYSVKKPEALATLL